MKTFFSPFVFGTLSLLTTAVSAATFSLYGAVDTGLSYMHVRNGDDSLQMSTGNYAGPRFGFKGSEELTPGVTVNFILENGYNSDTGALDAAGKMFNRESILYLKTPYGTFGVGRTGPFTSGTGSLSRYWDLEPFETGYSDAGIQGTQVNVWSRHSNTLYYVSPKVAGWEAGIQYSLSGDQDAETDGMADDDHFANAYVRWDGPTLIVAAGVELYTVGQTREAVSNQPNKDRWSVKLAGAWTPQAGATTLFAGYNFFNNQNKFSDTTWLDDTNLTFDDSGKGIEAHAFYLGIRHKVGQVAWLGLLQFMTGENKGALAKDEDEFKRFVAGLGAHYYFSKRTMGYAVASYAKGTGLLDQEGSLTNRCQAHLGVTHWF